MSDNLVSSLSVVSFEYYYYVSEKKRQMILRLTSSIILMTMMTIIPNQSRCSIGWCSLSCVRFANFLSFFWTEIFLLSLRLSQIRKSCLKSRLGCNCMPQQMPFCLSSRNIAFIRFSVLKKIIILWDLLEWLNSLAACGLVTTYVSGYCTDRIRFLCVVWV